MYDTPSNKLVQSQCGLLTTAPGPILLVITDLGGFGGIYTP
nr:hypothetical protein [Paracoccus sp. (in: a-proteobacteria)]